MELADFKRTGKTSKSLTFTANATASKGSTLNYTLHVGDKIYYLNNQAPGVVTLEATDLSNYTEYACYVEVSKNNKTVRSEGELHEKTLCSGTTETCSVGYTTSKTQYYCSVCDANYDSEHYHCSSHSSTKSLSPGSTCSVVITTYHCSSKITSITDYRAAEDWRPNCYGYFGLTHATKRLEAGEPRWTVRCSSGHVVNGVCSEDMSYLKIGATCYYPTDVTCGRTLSATSREVEVKTEYPCTHGFADTHYYCIHNGVANYDGVEHDPDAE